MPEELLDLPPVGLIQALGAPTLIRVPGTGEQRPRAISTLLHGDESTGLEAVTRVLSRRRRHPFDLFVLIGNVRAAIEPPGFAHRYLDDQEDYNRIWGLRQPTTRLRQAADSILERLLEADLETLVDVHNNSGDNPFYAIVTSENEASLNLATLFTSTILRWDLAAHTLMEALPDVASIAVECGLPGRPQSLAFALDGMRRYLGEPPIPTASVRRDYDLLGHLRKVMVRPEVRFDFGGSLHDELDFVVVDDAERMNFVELPAGEVIGRVQEGGAVPLIVIDAAGDDVTDEHFEVIAGGVVVARRNGTPVMMTRSVEAARKDCLFYLADTLRSP